MITINEIDNLDKMLGNYASTEDLIDDMDMNVRLTFLYHCFEENKIQILNNYLMKGKNIRTTLYFFQMLGFDLDVMTENPDLASAMISIKYLNDPPKAMFLSNFIKTLSKSLKGKESAIQKVTKEYEILLADNIKDFVALAKKFDSSLDIFRLANSVFASENVDVERKQKLFDYMATDSHFLSYPYHKIIEDNPEIVVSIKGFAKYLTREMYLKILDPEHIKEIIKEEGMDGKEEYYQALIDFFKDILEVNKDNPNVYQLVALMIESVRSSAPEVFEEFDKLHLYDKKDIPNKKEIFNHILEDIRENNSSELLENYLIGFANSKEFKDNFDELYQLFIQGNNKNYLNLGTCILINILNEQKKKLGVNVELVLTSENSDENTLGSYSIEKQALYLNRYYLATNENYLEGFVNGIDTIFHELRHAEQFQKIYSELDYDYMTLLGCIDAVSQDNTFNSYYKDNYIILAPEVDARAVGFEETCRYLTGQDQLLQLYTANHKKEDEHVSYRVRLDRMSIEHRKVPEEYFLEEINSIYESSKEVGKTQNMPDLGRREIDDIFSKYPTLSLLYYYDNESDSIKMYSREKIIEWSQSSDQKLKLFYQNVLYDLDLQIYFEDPEYVGYKYNEVIGEPPKRK